jgi:cell wall assembly regulator SMI1
MPKFIEALEFINDWVERNMADHPAVMRQGLSRREIESKVEILPFHLAEEVYELYQWRNGGKNLLFLAQNLGI